jgi:hypothetical protein
MSGSTSSASADLLSLLFQGAAPASASHTSGVQQQHREVQDGLKGKLVEEIKQSSSIDANQSASNALLAMLNQSSNTSANPRQSASSSTPTPSEAVKPSLQSQSIPSSASPSLPNTAHPSRKESPFHFFSPFDALTANLGSNRSVTSPAGTTVSNNSTKTGSGLRAVSMGDGKAAVETPSELPPLPKSPEPVKDADTALSTGSILDLLNKAAQARRDEQPQPQLQIQEPEAVSEEQVQETAETETLPGATDDTESVSKAHQHLANAVTEQTCVRPLSFQIVPCLTRPTGRMVLISFQTLPLTCKSSISIYH